MAQPRIASFLAFSLLLLVFSNSRSLLVPFSFGQSELTIQELRLLSDTQAELILIGPSDEVYTVEVTNNLIDWTTVKQSLPDRISDGDISFSLDLPEDWKEIFYRVSYQFVFENPDPIIVLNAPANEPAFQHLPDMGMPLEDEAEVEFVLDVLPVSKAYILVTLKEGTTVQALNSLLATEGVTIAGAVPSMNLATLRRNEITNLEDLGNQMIRLEDSGLFSSVAPNLGLSPPNIVEEPSASSIQPLNAGGSFDLWTWEADGLGKGSGGNNAFELSRIPQLWNWLDYGYRQKQQFGGHDIVVLEFDFVKHVDLDEVNDVTLEFVRNNGTSGSHGVAVIGVIAADHNNDFGTQGVTPLPDRVRGIQALVNTPSAHSYSSSDLAQVASILNSANAPRIINISAGYPWFLHNPSDPEEIDSGSFSVFETGADWMDRLGELWASCFETLNTNIPDAKYLIVCSAGDSGGIDARYNSPWANVACRTELSAMAPNFLVVENVQSDLTPFRNADYNYAGAGDSVSAGGSNIIALSGPESTDFSFGTNGSSYSAPLVSGMASFLWSLDPGLTVGEVKYLLTTADTTQEVGSGRSDLADGFAAALGIDILKGNYEMQRALVDVDDGTRDGNLRDTLYFSEDPDAIHTDDGRRGDGKITMRDFRAFRDAYLQVLGEAEHLDGSPTHFKRDLNFDGLVENVDASPAHPAPYEIVPSTGASLSEAIYSRYDFNGNGELDGETAENEPSFFALSPFKVDPDTEVDKRDVPGGILRDVDVLLEPAIWEVDEENVSLTGESETMLPRSSTPPPDWSRTRIDNPTFAGGQLSYLWSFDLHVDMDGGDPVNGAKRSSEDFQYAGGISGIVHDGLWISSWLGQSKARLDEWEGVITVPFPDPNDSSIQNLPDDFPLVTIYYKKTVEDEFHQYFLNFKPEPGEDISLAVGFDEFQFYLENGREFPPGLANSSKLASATETIARVPDTGPYTTIFVPRGMFQDPNDLVLIQNAARVAAIELLSERLLTPEPLNDSPGLEAIYSYTNEGSSYKVDIYGLDAIYGN